MKSNDWLPSSLKVEMLLSICKANLLLQIWWGGEFHTQNYEFVRGVVNFPWAECWRALT